MDKFNKSKKHVKATSIGYLGGGKTFIHRSVVGAILGAGTASNRKVEASHLEYRKK